jgi:hypothetical protein
MRPDDRALRFFYQVLALISMLFPMDELKNLFRCNLGIASQRKMVTTVAVLRLYRELTDCVFDQAGDLLSRR